MLTQTGIFVTSKELETLRRRIRESTTSELPMHSLIYLMQDYNIPEGRSLDLKTGEFLT